jgi:hypothetical protein
VELTGEITANLYVKSTAPDTDFIVRVSDVYPDGRSILIVDYIRRARYRDGFDKQRFLKQGMVHEVQFHVGHLSQVFNTGHKIRVTVASTGAPLYEPNPQNGKPETIAFPEDARSAVNTIYHSERYASHLLVPRAHTTYGSR